MQRSGKEGLSDPIFPPIVARFSALRFDLCLSCFGINSVGYLRKARNETLNPRPTAQSAGWLLSLLVCYRSLNRQRWHG